MESSSTDREKILSVVHILIGGAICFVPALLLPSIAQASVEFLLNNTGNGAFRAFDEATNGFYMMMFGLIYLPSGFCGGLYTGAKTKENLKVALAVTGVVGFGILTILGLVSGSFDLSTVDLKSHILIPVLGIIIGAYLGGYTMGTKAEEVSEEPEKMLLEIGKLPTR